jgi:hypothetical protein
MLSDGLAQKQSETNDHENVKVVDVAQALLADRRRTTPSAPASTGSRRRPSPRPSAQLTTT